MSSSLSFCSRFRFHLPPPYQTNGPLALLPVLIGISCRNGSLTISLGVLPGDVVAHGSSLGADFRIVDDLNHEAPYFLTTLQSESKIEKRASRILERSFVAGQFTRIVFRITDEPALDETHGFILKQLNAEPWFKTYRIATPENDFMYWVETAVSDDAHQWRVGDARSPISRFRKARPGRQPNC